MRRHACRHYRHFHFLLAAMIAAFATPSHFHACCHIAATPPPSPPADYADYALILMPLISLQRADMAALRCHATP